MDWTIKLAGNLLLSSFSVMGLFALWQAVIRIFKHTGLYKYSYFTLKILTLIILLPFWSIMEWLSRKQGKWSGIIGFPTETIQQFSRVFLAIWFLGIVVLTGYYLIQYLRLRKCIRAFSPVSGAKKIVFEEVADRMGIKNRKIKVYESQKLSVPFLCGIISPVIVIPSSIENEEVLRVVYIHELTHYQRKDLLWKTYALLIQILFWLQPFAWLIRRSLQEWSEYMCDYYSAGFFQRRKVYFSRIVDLLMANQENDLSAAAFLFQNKKEMQKRISESSYLKTGEAIPQKKKMVGIVFSIAGILVITGISTVFAHTYLFAYQNTVNEIVETADSAMLDRLGIESADVPAEAIEYLQSVAGNIVKEEFSDSDYFGFTGKFSYDNVFIMEPYQVRQIFADGTETMAQSWSFPVVSMHQVLFVIDVFKTVDGYQYSVEAEIVSELTKALGSENIGIVCYKYRENLCGVDPFIDYENSDTKGRNSITVLMNLSGTLMNLDETEKPFTDWNKYSGDIQAKTVKVIGQFDVKQGDSLKADIYFKSCDLALKEGIMDSSGNRWSIELEKSSGHTFQNLDEGRYYLFLENTTKEFVGVEGRFAIIN